jgi:hypothetical protein
VELAAVAKAIIRSSLATRLVSARDLVIGVIVRLWSIVPTLLDGGEVRQLYQDAEEWGEVAGTIPVLAQRAQLGSSQPPLIKRYFAVALLVERRVLARRGWVGEKASHFEHPVWRTSSCGKNVLDNDISAHLDNFQQGPSPS